MWVVFSSCLYVYCVNELEREREVKGDRSEMANGNTRERGWASSPAERYTVEKGGSAFDVSNTFPFFFLFSSLNLTPSSLNMTTVSRLAIYGI